jgi:hypothetical protein
MEDGSVGERSAGIVERLSAGGSVGERSDGRRALFVVVPFVLVMGVRGEPARTGDLVRVLFSGLGDFILEEASATSSNDRFLSCCLLTGE